MANEVYHRYTATGSTLYFTIRNTARQMWNTAGTPNFETLTVANWGDYDVALSESPASSYFYHGTFPAISGNMVAGWYFIELFLRAGGSPAISDSMVASYFGYWDGTTFKFWADDIQAWVGTVPSAYSTTRGTAGTALPAAAADAAGGLPISDAGGLDLDAKLANTNEVTVARMGALTDWIDGGRLDLILDSILADTGTDGVIVTGISAANLAKLEDMLDGTGQVLTLTQLRVAANNSDAGIYVTQAGTGDGAHIEGFAKGVDIVGRTGAAVASTVGPALSLSAGAAATHALYATSAAAESVVNIVGATNQDCVVLNKDGTGRGIYTDGAILADGGISALTYNSAWDAEIQSEVADALDAAVPGSPTAGSINERVKTMDDADIPARLPAALSSGNMKSDMLAVNTSAAAAIRLALSAGQIIPFTVDSTAFTPTTTIFEADDITEATADHYKDRLVIWTSGALAGQMSDITAYALSSGRGRFTLTALTEAAANNDTGIIV